MKKKILIDGMSCEHCVAHVKEALENLEDAKNVEVNLEENFAVLETSCSDDVIKEAVEDEGFDVTNIIEL